METSGGGFRPESHVPQQSRRDKLRVQQVNSSTIPLSHHLNNLPNSLDQQFTLHHHQHHHPDHINIDHHVRSNLNRQPNFLFDPSFLSSEMLDFSRNHHHQNNIVNVQHQHHPHRNALTCQPETTTSMAAASSGDHHHHHHHHHHHEPPQSTNFMNWRILNNNNSNQQQSFDWGIMNNFPGTDDHQSNNNLKLSYSTTDSTTGTCKEVVESSLLTIYPSSTSHDHHHQGMSFHNHNNDILEDVVNAASSTRNQQEEMVLMTAAGNNELALLPSFVNQQTTLRFDNSTSGTASLMDHRTVDEGQLRSTTVIGDSNNNFQGLSLSLSSNPPSSSTTLRNATSTTDNDVVFKDFHQLRDSKPSAALKSYSIPKPSIISKACSGKSLQDIVGINSSTNNNDNNNNNNNTNINTNNSVGAVNNPYRVSSGPLGPFTGYATILKSSRFLKPAQQLLDEFCGANDASKLIIKRGCCDVSDTVSGELSASVSASISVSAEAGVNGNGIESEVLGKGNNSCATSFYSSNEISGDGGVGSISFESARPEHHQKKAKLLYMQEEVSRRYKQYRQQMQMVVSSFESVSGLSSATPYISLALKAVMRHFHCLKSAIADQLTRTRRALGEDILSSPTTGSSSKGDHAMSAAATAAARLKYMEQSFQKHKSGGANMVFPEPQQPVWRPQRGLPERSVAILRAWLFEHFLHPYPTDTDKHMLATQTGLTRNQVSNWFINARVRVWKPMVEEIHMLETKGLTEVDHRSNPGKHDVNPANEGTCWPGSNDQNSTKLGIVTTYSSGISNRDRDGSLNADQQQSHEKRSRLDCQVPTSMAGALVGFVPYHRTGLEVWSHARQ